LVVVEQLVVVEILVAVELLVVVEILVVVELRVVVRLVGDEDELLLLVVEELQEGHWVESLRIVVAQHVVEEQLVVDEDV